LRIAAVLAVLAVVLIGLSVTLRGDADTVRLDVEELLLEEIDGLRTELRAELGNAARSTHNSLGGQLQRLQADVEGLRGWVESAGAGSAPGGQTRVEARGYPPGADPPGRDRGYEQGNDAGRPHPIPSGGHLRHTETVRATTRHTIVDPHGDPSAGAGYAGGGYGGRGAPLAGDRPGQDQRGRRPTQYDETGTEMHSEDHWTSARREEPRRVPFERPDDRWR